MNGALDSVSAFPTITFLMAFAGPVLTLLLAAFLWFGPRRLRMPAVLPGIPLALTSIAFQMLIGAYGILIAFQEISTSKRAGVRNVAGSMAAVTGSFTTAIYLSIGCVVALVIYQAIRDRRDEQTKSPEPGNKLAPRIVLFFTALCALATMALLWVFERALDLVMVICDNARKAEAQQRLGNIPIAEVAGMISRRLFLCEFFSLALLAFFLTAPFWLLAGDPPEWVREKSLTLAIVTALCLIPFGIVYHQELLYMITLAQPRQASP